VIVQRGCQSQAARMNADLHQGTSIGETAAIKEHYRSMDTP